MDQANSQAEHHHAEQGAQGREGKVLHAMCGAPALGQSVLDQASGLREARNEYLEAAHDLRRDLRNFLVNGVEDGVNRGRVGAGDGCNDLGCGLIREVAESHAQIPREAVCQLQTCLQCVLDQGELLAQLLLGKVADVRKEPGDIAQRDRHRVGLRQRCRQAGVQLRAELRQSHGVKRHGGQGRRGHDRCRDQIPLRQCIVYHGSRVRLQNGHACGCICFGLVHLSKERVLLLLASSHEGVRLRTQGRQRLVQSSSDRNGRRVRKRAGLRGDRCRCVVDDRVDRIGD
mmetsp:Transcript_95737/g.308810  ORF Transcript_95737/g.308810 Transcript_95737/m.308810 type:complete len:287 (-) Transcript_95737:503-1363(-)